MTLMLERITSPFKTVVRFLKDVWGELQRVVWPSHEDTYGFTGVVIVAVAIVAVWVALLDYIFTNIVSTLGLYE